MNKKIVISGGTGFIGTYLQHQFGKLGYQVIIISRQNDHIQWDDTNKIIESLDNSTMLINLAGKSVDCRYNSKNKAAIMQSRTETTTKLGNALLKCSNPPELWINSSTATIYRHAEDRPMTEDDGVIGAGFSVNVAKNWEQSLFDFELPSTRQVALRMAIVLGRSGGAMQPLVNLVRMGLGGKQGDGHQMFSWIHIEDLFNIILLLQSNKSLQGVFNCSSPNPIDNVAFMKALRQCLNVPFGLPSPKWLLEIGALFIRTETELILKSRWVVPDRLLKIGYTFKYPDIETTFRNILHDE